MNTQYRDIVNAFKNFLTQHRNVQKVIDSQNYDFQAQENEYPAVVIVPGTSTTNIGAVQMQFSIFFCDVLLADKSNCRDVYNDMLETAKDFISYFTGDPDTSWGLLPDCTLIPFEEHLDDFLAGWQLDCTIELPFHHGICDLPLEIIEPVDLPPQADFVVFIVSNHVTIVNKSKNYEHLQWEYSGANVQDITRDELVRLVYPEPGTYEIKLTAYRTGYEPSICTKTITIQ